MDNKTQINVINTNARSLRPKIASFVRCFVNLSLTFAIITETWLASGSRLERQSEDLLLGHGLSTYYLNRAPSANGVAHGGVAVVAKNSRCKMSVIPFPNVESFEVLPLVLDEYTIRRNFYIVAAYIPPGYTVARGKACLAHIRDLILHVKNICPDPYIIVAGDFNQWEVGEALLDYPDLMEVITPPTRLDRNIDKMFVNWHGEITESGCLPPLETEELYGGTVTYSDHPIQYLCSRLDRKEPVRWESFTYRPFTDGGGDGFVADIGRQDWSALAVMQDANSMATVLQHIVDDLTERHFPVKTIRRKEDDLPRLDSTAKKMIAKKKAVYKCKGNSPRWITLRNKLDEHLDRRQQAYLARQREKMTSPDAASQFFKNVKAYSAHEKPKDFDVKDLCPGMSDSEAADAVARYFKRISSEFQPLEPRDITATYQRDLL